jgi:hypothetical protein
VVEIGKALTQLGRQWHGAVAVLHVGGVDVDGEQVASRTR